MSFDKYEYEVVHTDQETDDPLAENHLSHTDSRVTARAMTLVRARWLRRFVFFETLPNQDSLSSRPFVFPVHQGFHNTDDGSVVILDGSGHPHGWYSSLVCARRRLRRKHELWLAWLEPAPAIPAVRQTVIEQEARHGAGSTWYLTIPYTAHGFADARQRAVDTAIQVEPCLPGLDRLDVTYRNGGDLETETHAFCETVGCPLPPGHEGEHDPDETHVSTDD